MILVVLVELVAKAEKVETAELLFMPKIIISLFLMAPNVHSKVAVVVMVATVAVEATVEKEQMTLVQIYLVALVIQATVASADAEVMAVVEATELLLQIQVM